VFGRQAGRSGTVAAGRYIGKVIQTHRGWGAPRNLKTRPPVFDRERHGRFCDIGSQQFDQFLFFTD